MDKFQKPINSVRYPIFFLSFCNNALTYTEIISYRTEGGIEILNYESGERKSYKFSRLVAIPWKWRKGNTQKPLCHEKMSLLNSNMVSLLKRDKNIVIS
jgi:hypothetical protein